MTETDHLYLDRQGQRDLRDTLATIPALAERIVVTLARMDQLVKPDQKRRQRGRPGSTPDGVNLPALDDWVTLHAVLVSWVRQVVEDRGVTPPSDDLLSIAAWLVKNMAHLAACEGAEEAPNEIEHWVIQCERHIDLPPEDSTYTDAARREQALDSVVTMSTIATVAKRLGPMGDGLTERRLKTLIRSAGVTYVAQDPDTNTKFYRLRDILDAHHRHPCRSVAV